MPQPNACGMEPAFGDAFRSFCTCSSSDQTVASPDSRPDSGFLCEQERQLAYTNSSRNDLLSLNLYRSPVKENIELLSDLVDDEPSVSARCERWDVSALEDFAKYIKADLWTNKELDLLGLEETTSPYQNEARVSQSPTLADLNADDPQQVADSWCLFRLGKEVSPFSGRSDAAGRSTEASKKAHWLDPLVDSGFWSDGVVFVQKKEDQLSQVKDTAAGETTHPGRTAVSPRSGNRALLDQPSRPGAPADSVSGTVEGATHDQTGQISWKPARRLAATEPGAVRAENASVREEGGCASIKHASEAATELKYNEHNYSLFSAESLGVHPSDNRPESGEASDTEQEDSENEDEEEEDDDDDKDDYSDYLSEAGNEHEVSADVAFELGVRRLKRRYFWEYSDSHTTPSKQERILQPSEWDSSTLPRRRTVRKSRRTNVDDLTPNPRRLLHIGGELKKLNKVIDDLRPVSELPMNARPRSRKEKNKLASRACRLKKKAQHEANKIKLWGLNAEHDNLLQVIGAIKQQIMQRVEKGDGTKEESMTEALQRLLKGNVGQFVAGQTSEFVNEVLEKASAGEPMTSLS
ncbi:CREB3 regulatory factor-like isoform X2 [Narcine bancroftii]|uniref:CREB3 regulatory factor-like isoform X2 n=1 Tax=Narcine bancroftii TaxID=1343680 RepID=UPI0038318BD2